MYKPETASITVKAPAPLNLCQEPTGIISLAESWAYSTTNTISTMCGV
jgi:hypothetical protein